MPDFSTILQTPEIRQIVQENILERAFHDALFPRLLYRGEATPQRWEAQIGDTQIFTGTGLPPVTLRPLIPGRDPDPVDYPKEQWKAQCNKYGSSIDTHMPTSIVAIANLFYRNAQQIGLQSGMTLNRIVRNRMFQAALAGNTVADGIHTGTATLRVKRLNGFTTARRPDLAAGSQVRFETVSATNPLPFLYGAGMTAGTNIIGFTPDNAGDDQGPGTLALDGNISCADRAPILAVDRSLVVRPGGGLSIDALTTAPTNYVTMTEVRSAVSQLRQQNVPPHADMRYHCHLDTVSEAELFADAEFQRLETSLPDYFQYRDFAIGEILGCAFIRNTESPIPDTVGSKVATFPTPFSLDDPFCGELVNATKTIHRLLFTGQDAIFEYYQDLAQQLTEAGVTGRTGVSTITNNGIEINTDRIALYIRAPLNRLQDMVASTWAFGGDWPVRTDAAVGSFARYKRLCCVEHI